MTGCAVLVASSRHTPSGQLTAMAGLLARGSLRCPAFPAPWPVAFSDFATAYSCGGSHGLGPRGASPYSLFTPDLSIRGTIAGDPIVTAAAWQWRFVSGTCGGAPLLWRNVAGAPRVAVAVLVAALEQGNQRFDDHAACPLQLGNGSGRSRHSCGAKTGSSTRQASSSARIRLSSIGSQPMKTSSWRRSPHIGSK